MENKHKQFNAYDKVLVRESKKWPWRASFYSHYNPISYHHYTTSGAPINEVLPYEGNEHLLGTTDEPEAEILLEKGEWIFVASEVYDWAQKWSLIELDCIKHEQFCTGLVGWSYAVKYSNFNPYDMEETRKHILCIKNGKIIRYKS